jgi:hypothetical protein
MADLHGSRFSGIDVHQQGGRDARAMSIRKAT